VVRRLKDDIREIQGGFPTREVVQIDIAGLPEDAPELRLAKLLDEYRELREERLSSETKRKQAAAGLLVTGLQQRLLSSIEAFARTLRVHRKTVKKHWEQGGAGSAEPQVVQSQLDLLAGSVGSDDDRAGFSEDELQTEEEAQIEAVSAATVGPTAERSAKESFAQEQKLLDEMTEIAEQARDLPDARVKELLKWIRRNMCPDLGKPGAKWNDTRVIIFTEYDDTKRYLRQQLETAITDGDRADQRIAVYHGPTPPKEREEIKQAFNADPKKHPVRILIATDAAREGINLQAHCWNLFHFDVPWNPSRMEQRNGRIDRKLQPKDQVFCHYFVYKQRPEDRILQVLVRKTHTIKSELGSLAQVIDARLAKTLSQGIRRKALDQLATEIESADLEAEHRRTVEEELEAARQRQNTLREQIDRLRKLLEASQESIGLDEDHFRSAISCALELVGAEPLQSTSGGEPGPPRFSFPAVDQRHGADPTWAETMDTLRAPRKRDEKFWEWRSNSPIRPVVFEDTGTMDDDVVHLHLEHRIVQRLLGHFTAQGFVHHDLSRACLAQTKDAIPRVILLGRLCLYGPGAARLHEELIPVTAQWTDPKIRKAALRPYGREAETKTLNLLEQAFVDGHGRTISDTVLTQLQAAAPRDVQELLPSLQNRGDEYAQDAEEQLKKRGEAEAKAMREILETQKKHIAATVAKHEKMDPRQLALQFGDEESERRQLEADKRYWAARLESLEDELTTEPERVRGLYEVKAKRIEPVGLVYLWPVTG